MVKKIETIPFGGEIPPDLAAACNELQTRRGWVKKRMLAAAMRAFVTASDKQQEEWYFEAYCPILSEEEAAKRDKEISESLDRLKRQAGGQARPKRRKEGTV